MAQNEDRPVRDEGIPPLPRQGYKAGGRDQGELPSRKADLLNTGTVGRVPGYAGSRRLADMQVQDAHPHQDAFRPAVSQAGPRPLPHDQPVYSTPAPGGTGVFTRYLDGSTRLHRERPELVEYHNSLDPTDPDDADERESVAAEIAHRDAVWTHKFW